MTQATPSIAASEGDWTEWKGGECPVGRNERVDTLFRDGGECLDEPAWVWAIGIHDWWKHEGGPGNNIIAYRIVRTALQEQSK